MITITTVNKQTKQDGKGGLLMLRFKNGAICFVFPAHLIILWIFHRTVAAYPVWHYAQRGSGTSTDGPGVLQRGCCLLTGSQPSGDSWDSEPVTVSGDVQCATRGGGVKLELMGKSRCL